jgi:NhaP-type Na+/H+ or K+/H+ antiporter
MDQWAATILVVIMLSISMMHFMPGTSPPAATNLLIIAITFGVSIGFAVMGAVVVAQRFIERHEGEKPAFPPFAELVLAALIVVGLSMAMRIGIPLVPALIGGDSSALQGVVTQFWEKVARDYHTFCLHDFPWAPLFLCGPSESNLISCCSRWCAWKWARIVGCRFSRREAA